MGIPNKCYGCHHYEGNAAGVAGSILCSISGRKQTRNGVAGCSLFSPDELAGCDGCHYSLSGPPGPLCEKNLTSMSAGGHKDGYCHGYAKRNYWNRDDFGEKKKGGCFITASACHYLGMSDDCELLISLRRFRDEVLLQSDEWQHLVSEYYLISGALLEKIEASEKRDEIYVNIYNSYLILLAGESKTRIEHVNKINIYQRMICYIGAEVM